MKAILVGAGTIGVRHLQGLAQSPRLKELVVVDPAPGIEETVLPYWKESAVSKNKHISFETFGELAHKPNADFALVATSSSGRLNILEQLLSLDVKNILLEKILFQSVSQHKRAIEKIQHAKAQVRTNLPYRMVPVFKSVKDKVAGKKITMKVENGDRGFGCNGIHFFDLFEFISQRRLTDMNVQIEGAIRNNTRGSEYCEFGGYATVGNEGGSQCEVIFNKAYDTLPNISVSWDGGTFEADYNTGLASISDVEVEKNDFYMPMASQIAHTQMHDMLDKTSSLPTIENAFLTNKCMLNAYNKALGLPPGEDTLCPIT